jgi:molecular chaperone DnaK (HSP70)
MRVLRLALPCTDEPSLAAHLGDKLGEGGVWLPTTQRAAVGDALQVELTGRTQDVLFAFEGAVEKRVEKPEPAALVRFTHLSGADRATLDRLLLHRDGATALGLPAPSRGGARPQPWAPPLPLAVDIGHTLARAAFVKEGKVQLVSLTPGPGGTQLSSAVALDDKGRILVGARARTQGGIDRASAIGSPLALLELDPGSARDAERVRKLPVAVRDDDRGPIADLSLQSAPAIDLFAALAQEVRNRAQDAAGQVLHHVGLVVDPLSPPHTRQWLQAALGQAGFGQVELIAAPLAIAQAYGFTAAAPAEGPLLVVDWGGTQLQLSLVGFDGPAGALEVWAAGTRRGVGGAAVDERVSKVLLDRLEASLGERLADPLARQRVLDAAQAARVQLMHQPEVQVRIPWVATRPDGEPVDLDVVLKAAELHRVLEPALDGLRRGIGALLEQAGVTPDEVAHVLLAGGQCTWPKVAQALLARFPGRVLSSSATPPTTAAVLGAARLLGEKKAAPAAVLAAPVGVLQSDGELRTVLEAGARLPARASVAVKAQGGAGLLCPVAEGGAQTGYLGSLRLSGVQGEATLTLQVDPSQRVLVQLSAGTAQVEAMWPLASAGREAEADLWRQRAVPPAPALRPARPVTRAAPPPPLPPPNVPQPKPVLPAKPVRAAAAPVAPQLPPPQTLLDIELPGFEGFDDDDDEKTQLELRPNLAALPPLRPAPKKK